jgi:hypothetical protein
VDWSHVLEAATGTAAVVVVAGAARKVLAAVVMAGIRRRLYGKQARPKAR